jgi:hypothetical protein
MTDNRNYRELWMQLRAIVVHGRREPYTPQELWQLLYELELDQAAQEVMRDLSSLVKDQGRGKAVAG